MDDNTVIGKVISAKEDNDGLTVKIDVNPLVDTKELFDEFYKRGVRPNVALANPSIDYASMYIGSNRRLRVGYVPYGAIHIDRVYGDIVGIYVNRKKETVVLKWSDGEITKVHRRKGDKFDLEAAVNAAIVKRLISSHTEYQKKIEAITEYQD